ncbi:hypothetical protein ACH518_18145 [Methylomonas sp. HW2-6]|uniref:hypothetical protein n=1 Tax=Methylomonas sp. HW2-6 TaxID=3376687 RepID=UPI004042C46F
MKTTTHTDKYIRVNSRWLLGLALPLLLAACAASPTKPVAFQTSQIQSLLIVPVAAPPLEVIPDLLEQRDAAYRHTQNMAMGVALDRQNYQTAGGIVVAGMLSNAADDVDAMIDALPPTAAGGRAAQTPWTPEKSAAEALQGLLAQSNRGAELSRDGYRLAATDDASLPQWRRAIQAWYAQDLSQTNYASRGQYDAVIELGVGRYRIFEGQTSLQLMLKLIDPASGRVLARAHSESFRVDDGALASLQHDGKAFRQLIAEMAVPLLRQSLGDLGLRNVSNANQS